VDTSSPDIPAETARHVLWHMGATGGSQSGTFTQALLHAIVTADRTNRAALARIFPAQVAALELATRDENGITTLQNIAAGGQ
jgi:hypothetical protein